MLFRSVEVQCGACTGDDVCDANLCRIANIWKCDAVNYGAASCVDFLERDGWNAVEADAACQISSPDQPGVVTEVQSQALACIGTTAHPKRCTANDVGTGIPAYAQPYYVYVPSYFPDQVCGNNLNGVIELAPWPAY